MPRLDCPSVSAETVAPIRDAPSQFGAGCAALAFRFVRPEVTYLQLTIKQGMDLG